MNFINYSLQNKRTLPSTIFEAVEKQRHPITIKTFLFNYQTRHVIRFGKQDKGFLRITF